MKKLDKTIYGRGSVKGYVFTQLISTEGFYIYEAKSPIHTFKYEVFRRKVVNVIDSNRRITEEKKETYPRDKDFGVTAWCCSTLQEALIKLNNIKNEKQIRNRKGLHKQGW